MTHIGSCRKLWELHLQTCEQCHNAAYLADSPCELGRAFHGEYVQAFYACPHTEHLEAATGPESDNG